MKSIFIFFFMLISCKQVELNSKKDWIIDLSVKNNDYLKSYKINKNGEGLILINKVGLPGEVFEFKLGSRFRNELLNYLNNTFTFKKDTTITSINNEENCSDPPMYLMYFINSYNHKIEFTGSACTEYSKMDITVFRLVNYCDSINKIDFFQTFEKVIPPSDFR